MPALTTAIEVERAMAEFEAFYRQPRAVVLEAIERICLRPTMEWLTNRLFPPRPYTDDMIQMLDDLGISVPDLPRRRVDDLAFEWRAPS